MVPNTTVGISIGARIYRQIHFYIITLYATVLHFKCSIYTKIGNTNGTNPTNDKNSGADTLWNVVQMSPTMIK